MKTLELNKTDDSHVLANLRILVQAERDNVIQILHHLREVERRRLYSQLKYKSLFDYVVGDLKYSESAAMRRISAMRIINEMPEMEARISSGALSLSNIAMARSAFANALKAGRKFTKEERRSILGKLENLSARESRRVLNGVSPIREKGLNFSDIQNDELRSRLLELKGRFAHVAPLIELEEMLMRICEGLLGPKNKTQEKIKEIALPTSAVDFSDKAHDNRRKMPIEIHKALYPLPPQNAKSGDETNPAARIANQLSPYKLITSYPLPPGGIQPSKTCASSAGRAINGRPLTILG